MLRDSRRTPLPMRRRRRATTLGLLAGAVLGATTLGAATLSSAVSPAQAAESATTPSVKIPVQKYELKNGLTVLMSPDHSLPVVAVEVRYLVGSSHEAKGKSGFAHLFEHLMFQGSEHFNHEYFAPFELRVRESTC